MALRLLEEAVFTEDPACKSHGVIMPSGSSIKRSPTTRTGQHRRNLLRKTQGSAITLGRWREEVQPLPPAAAFSPQTARPESSATQAWPRGVRVKTPARKPSPRQIPQTARLSAREHRPWIPSSARPATEGGGTPRLAPSRACERRERKHAASAVHGQQVGELANAALAQRFVDACSDGHESLAVMFQEAQGSIAESPQAAMQKALRDADGDSDGLLTPDELRRVAKQLGAPCPPFLIQQVCCHAVPPGGGSGKASIELLASLAEEYSERLERARQARARKLRAAKKSLAPTSPMTSPRSQKRVDATPSVARLRSEDDDELEAYYLAKTIVEGAEKAALPKQRKGRRLPIKPIPRSPRLIMGEDGVPRMQMRRLPPGAWGGAQLRKQAGSSAPSLGREKVRAGPQMHLSTLSTSRHNGVSQGKLPPRPPLNHGGIIREMVSIQGYNKPELAYLRNTWQQQWEFKNQSQKAHFVPHVDDGRHALDFVGFQEVILSLLWLDRTAFVIGRLNAIFRALPKKDLEEIALDELLRGLACVARGPARKRLPLHFRISDNSGQGLNTREELKQMLNMNGSLDSQQLEVLINRILDVARDKGELRGEGDGRPLAVSLEGFMAAAEVLPEIDGLISCSHILKPIANN